ncbi:MAG: phosphohydrolase [Desulfobulbus propionicus]|nr:MAG: phosphohydrolase [Desulfobulbus propionicus]
METPPELAPYLEALLAVSRQYGQAEGGPHDFEHSLRVFHTALAIGREMQADLQVLGSAALLHDIGRKAESESKGKICHAIHGAKLAAPLLRELEYPEQTIKAICHCIRSHRFRGKEKPESMEAKILFDADKLDSIGAVGIGRAFLFAGQVGARLHNPEIDPAATKAYSIEDSAYREYQVKMCKVKDSMLTPVGRKIARHKHLFMETFFTQLNNEIFGGLASITGSNT